MSDPSSPSISGPGAKYIPAAFLHPMTSVVADIRILCTGVVGNRIILKVLDTASLGEFY